MKEMSEFDITYWVKGQAGDSKPASKEHKTTS